MVYVHFAEGFEEVEAVTIVDLLRRAAIDVKMVSIMEDKMVEGAHGMQIQADLLFEEADYDGCDMIVLPGGMPGALHLKNHEELGEKITEFALQGKALAAICAAPMVLDARGALTHKTATIYPGMQNELNMASYIDSGVVEDGNVITGKGSVLPAVLLRLQRLYQLHNPVRYLYQYRRSLPDLHQVLIIPVQKLPV